MAIGYTEIDFVNGSAPALNATNLNKIDEALKDACDELDALGVVATLDAKTSVADADELLTRDSAASSAVKKVTWTTAFAAIWTKLGALIAGGTDKATPLDADTVPLSSAADSAATRKLTWANLKATLKAYNDTLYPTLAHASRHQHGGTDEIATATAAANAIPKAGAGGTLAAGWIPAVTTRNANDIPKLATGGVLNANGVAFPAVQVASADANTLDDYEEGTWTPTIIGSTTAGEQTYSSQVGFYTKIGRLVTLNFRVQISGKDAGIAGDIYIGGVPIAIAVNSSANYRAGGGTAHTQGITLSANYTQLQLVVQNSDSFIRLYQFGSNQNYIAVPVTGLAAATVIAGTITYIV